ncbi:MAG TPA: peptidylprolyl isomerase [Allosphingosinicella sp.]|nr:peptidylprolyl isomerase [Allosphingosinicella sp.]
MKLSWLAKAAILLAAPVLSAVAAAQGGSGQPGGGPGGLNIPENVQFVGKQDPGVRKATAIVNGDVITGSDIDHRMALILTSNQIQLPPEEVERFRAQVLRNLIDETLQIQAAAQQELVVEERDVNQYYERLAQNFRQQPEAFSAYLRSIGSSERSMKRQIRGELAWQRLQRRQIEPFVTVGDEEVQALIANMNAQRGTAEYRVSEIFISATPETAAQAQANVARIVQQIRAGASFPAYARQFSEASTAATGGDLGWVSPAQLPDELAAVVTRMPIGAVSDPIAIPGGFSVVALADTRQILVADPRDAVLSLMQMSVALPAGSGQAQAEARGRQLGEVTQAMGGCGAAGATAQTLGAELISNDQVRVRELPPALQQMLLALSVGQATQPFGSPERVSVLILCGRDDPEVATGPSYDQVYSQLNEQRVNRRAQRYLRDLRRDAVIDYR